LSGHQRITWRRNIAEYFNRLSRVHERYRRQTDARRHIANVNMSSRSLIITVSICVNRGAYLFRPKPGEQHREHEFYRKLYPSIIKDIQVIF